MVLNQERGIQDTGIDKNNLVIKINFSNQIILLSFHLQGILLMLITLYFLKFKIEAVLIFGIWLAILTLPVVFLHVEYYLANKGKIIIIKDDELLIKKGCNTVVFKFSDLKTAILHKSASLDRGGMPLTPMEFYHWVEIISNSGERIIITCLMTLKLDELMDKLHGVQKIRKKCGFCTLLWRQNT
jgi:hypothetical protein